MENCRVSTHGKMDIRNVMENLEELLTCPLCSNVVRNPKLTPCLHTFCCDCLKDIARNRPYQTTISCPLCQTDIRKPEGNQFDSFPSNLYITRLLDLLIAKRRNYPDAACGNCQKKGILSAFCFACDTFMCDECLNAHNVITRSNTHRTVNLGKFKMKDFEDLLRRPMLCSHKFKEKGIVEYFCYDCNSCVCHVCNIAVQHTHRIVDLHEAASEQKLKLREMNSKLKDKVRMVEIGIRNVEHRSMEVDEQIEYLKKDITTKMDKLVAAIRTHQEEMIQNLETIRKDKIENLTFQLKLYETAMMQTESTFVYIEELVQRNISEEILNIKDHVTSRVEEIAKIQVGTNPAENEQVGYVPEAQIYDRLQSSSLGRIVTSLTEPSMSTAQGDGLYDVSAGEEAEFTVTSRNAQGEICYSEIDHVVVEVKSAMWGIIESRVRNYRNGTYDVTYLPRVPGPHRVQIEVGGHLIRDSPFMVEVQPPILSPLKSFGSHGNPDGKFSQPHGVAGSNKGHIVVSDSLKHRIHVFTSDGGQILDFGGEGTKDGKLYHPMAIAFDRSQKFVLVADSDNNRVQYFDVRTGKYVKKFGSEGSAHGQFNGPCGISVDGKDRVIVTDWNNHRVQVFSHEGKFLFKFGDAGNDRLIHPRFAIYHDAEERFVVSDTGNDVVKVYDQNGDLLRIIGKPGSKKGEFCGPRGLAIDKNQNIIVCDFENHRLQVFSIKGVVLNSFGTNGKGIGQFAFPLSVSVVGENRVIVSDWGNNRIQIFKYRDSVN